MYEVALREPMLPAVITEAPAVIKQPWWKSSKIRTVKVSDVFEYVTNEMVVYRVVPHADVAAQTKRLWRNLHKMYEMYSSPKTRLYRDGIKFRYREKDSLWIDVVFRQVDGEKKIEFFVGTTEFQAEKLKRRIENMMHVTLKEASLSDLQVPEENTIVQEMRLVRHDIFSLNTDTTERQTPIATVLNTVDELVHDGDFARLSIAVEHEDRDRWVKNALWAHGKLMEGKVPLRNGIGKAKPLAKKGFTGVVNTVTNLVLDLAEAINRSVFSDDKPLQRQILLNEDPLLEELKVSKLDKATKVKMNTPVWKQHMWVTSHSENQLVRDTLSESLATAVGGDSAQDNELRGVPVRGKAARQRTIQELNNLRLHPQTRMDRNVNLISTDEMSKLGLQMPDRRMQMQYADEMDAKYRIEVEIPSVLRTGKGIPLGTAAIKNRTISVDLPIDNPDLLYRTNILAGGMGCGKDTSTKNFVASACMKAGICTFVIDQINEPGSRGMADGLRDALPPDKIIDLDFSHEDYVIPLDLTEVVTALGNLGPSRFAGEVEMLFDMKAVSRARKYLTGAAKASGGSLHKIQRIIEDEKYRNEVIDDLMKNGDKYLAKDLKRWGTNDTIGQKANPILDRLDVFFGNDRLRDIFSQEPMPGLDFAKWMREGKVVILRVPNRKFGTVATRTLVHWITLKIFMTRLLMEKEQQENGCFVVYNEPEQYMTPELSTFISRIATEGRKERIGQILCFHHWNKLPKDLQDNLLSGGVQQFLFANDHKKTFEISEHVFKDTIPLEQATSLPRFHAIVSVRAGNGELQPAFICKMLPPVKQKYDNAHISEEHAKRYGRHRDDLTYDHLYEDEEDD